VVSASARANWRISCRTSPASEPLEWVEIPEQCNWKVSVENYSECYHCSLNHPTFASGVIKPQTYDIQPQGHCLRHTTQSANLDRMSYPIDLESNPHAGDYSSWFLWPMFSFQVYPGNILNTYHWRAVDADHVVVWRGWYTIDGVDSDVCAGWPSRTAPPPWKRTFISSNRCSAA
jgi:phenylpropionate dioxygenase-like ring-hydroxylating dioxygenase large terminal subunit